MHLIVFARQESVRLWVRSTPSKPQTFGAQIWYQNLCIEASSIGCSWISFKFSIGQVSKQIVNSYVILDRSYPIRHFFVLTVRRSSWISGLYRRSPNWTRLTSIENTRLEQKAAISCKFTYLHELPIAQLYKAAHWYELIPRIQATNRWKQPVCRSLGSAVLFKCALH